jgi:AraC-like DNA-binding protein
MAELRTHSSGWLRGVIDVFAAQGVDTARLLHEAGIAPARLAAAHERFALEEVDRLWTLALAATHQANLGLDRPLARRYIHFELAAQAVSSSRDLGSGLVVLSQYLTLIGDAASFSIQGERGDRWLVFDQNGGGSPRQRVEFMMLALHLLCQYVTRHRVRLAAAEFIFPEPADIHPYRMAFHCPLRFAQPANRIRVVKEDLALPVVSSGESLHVMQDRVIEDRLTQMAGARTSYRASEELVRRLHLGQPRRQDVARSLGLTENEFGRRLRSEGHSFEQLLDGIRKDLAAQYLHQPGYEPQQVANLLGWEKAAQLTSACKRWFGVDTSEFDRVVAAPRKEPGRADADASTAASETVPMSQTTSVR